MSSHYNIKKSVTRGYYWFVTKHAIIYRCYFTVPLTFNSVLSLELKNPVFNFSFYPKKNAAPISMDVKTGETIAAILHSFFVKHPTAILFYICDDADSRAAIRQNRFRKWFEAHNSIPKKTLITGEVFGTLHIGLMMLEDNTERSIIRNYLEEQLQQLIGAEQTGTINELT